MADDESDRYDWDVDDRCQCHLTTLLVCSFCENGGAEAEQPVSAAPVGEEQTT